MSHEFDDLVIEFDARRYLISGRTLQVIHEVRSRMGGELSSEVIYQIDQELVSGVSAQDCLKLRYELFQYLRFEEDIHPSTIPKLVQCLDQREARDISRLAALRRNRRKSYDYQHGEWVRGRNPPRYA